MTNKIDWDNAPEGAEFFNEDEGNYYSINDGKVIYFDTENETWERSIYLVDGLLNKKSTVKRPQPKPKYEYGVEYETNGQYPSIDDDVIVEQYSTADNKWHEGPAGLWHWPARTITKFRIVDERYKPAETAVKQKHPTTSTEFLSACAQVQSERAKQYDASGTGERSFEAAAEAFNYVTGKNLRGSDVCLILEMVKLVRQYSDQTRLHEDSVLDAVSYASIWAEEITKELG